MEGSDVYPPSEDTYLLLETCLDEVESGETVLEVGTGSGLIGVRLAQEEGVSRVVATDVNPHAVRATREKALEKDVASNLDVVRTDLHASVRAEFDLVVFNPPYLPSDGGVSHDYAEKKI
ncbi:MAG: HemK2/MTQ2 family protein methyltransferase, partial [Halobacteria archaeon]|nr:HemK2/MTQ2 family protein methyltransferase [Halobacteria archaeon]